MSHLRNPLLFFCILLVVSCHEPREYTSNALYETIYDEELEGPVRSIMMTEGDLEFIFDCDRNLQKRIVPSKQEIWQYDIQGDTIINQIAPQQKLLYILNEQGKVSRYVSKVWDTSKSEWYDYYVEEWVRDEAGRLKEKRIQSVVADKKPYFISKIIYRYDGNRKVEIQKWGRDDGAKVSEDLLRTETRLKNEQGDWVVIEELDEDGIPFWKNNLSYEYDEQGNWITCYTREENHYKGKTSMDTIRRSITYHSKADCR